MPFVFMQSEIPDVIIIQPKVFKDERGFFLESFKHSDFIKGGIHGHFAQDNHSLSSRGVLRGLHYQINPHAQGKLVRCIRGKIFDVAVDLRKGSPYYGKWVSVELSDEDKKMFYIPAGFAHGLLVLSDIAEVLYQCTDEYSPDHDRGIIWNDHDIGIKWPVKDPVLSAKDRILPVFRDAENNFVF